LPVKTSQRALAFIAGKSVLAFPGRICPEKSFARQELLSVSSGISPFIPPFNLRLKNRNSLQAGGAAEAMPPIRLVRGNSRLFSGPHYPFAI
jgi:hypothetical protein